MRKSPCGPWILVGNHATTARLCEWCVRIAPTGIIPVMVGETGTGKRVVAQFIHSLSGRSGAFVPRSPGEIAPGLVLAELYGHTAGAFTGARRSRPGWFVEADRGSALIDEAHEMSTEFQAALRDALDGYGFAPVGLERRVIPDVRFMAASRWLLRLLVEQKKLQEDLFYRLWGWEIVLIPLRERREDIVPLIEHFLEAEAERRGEPRVQCSTEALEVLIAYQWPGNVRQLKRAILGAAQLAREGVIRLEDLPDDVLEDRGFPAQSEDEAADPRERTELALLQSKGNVTAAARVLHLSPGHVWRRIRTWGIDLGEIRQGEEAGSGGAQ